MPGLQSDVHVYYDQTSQDQTRYATELYERIRRECKCSLGGQSNLPEYKCRGWMAD